MTRNMDAGNTLIAIIDAEAWCARAAHRVQELLTLANLRFNAAMRRPCVAYLLCCYPGAGNRFSAMIANP